MVTISKKYSKTGDFGYVVLAIGIYSFVFGLRYGVGADFFGYMYEYESYSENGVWLYEKMEPAFKLLIIITSPFHSSSVFMGITAFIQLLLIAVCFKQDKRFYPYLFFIFMLEGVWSVHANAMRQFISIGLWAIAIQYAVNKKILYYYALIGLAILFHKSAFILLFFYPVIFFLRGSVSIAIQLLLLIVAISVMSMNYAQVFFETLDSYIRYLGYDYMDRREELLVNNDVKKGIGFYITLIMNIVTICYSKKLKQEVNSNYFNVLYQLYYIGIIMGYVFINSQLLGRLGMYFISFNFIIHAYLLRYAIVYHKVYLRFVYTSMIVLLFSALIYRAETSWNLFVFKGQTDYYYLHKGHNMKYI